MRNVLALAIAMLTTLLMEPADACGPLPMPRLYAVSRQIVGDPTAHVVHQFAVLDDRAPEDASWRWLATNTYVATQIADAPALATPVTLTLIGPHGTRVVKTTQRVYLKQRVDRAGSSAIDLGPTDDVVAIEGTLSWDARWFNPSCCIYYDAAKQRWRLHGRPWMPDELPSKPIAGFHNGFDYLVFDDNGRLEALLITRV
jgi:hypothetical protein